jgi:hypothetical protein
MKRAAARQPFGKLGSGERQCLRSRRAPEVGRGKGREGAARPSPLASSARAVATRRALLQLWAEGPPPSPPDDEKKAAFRRPGGRRLACEPEHPYRFVRPCTALKVNTVRFRRRPLTLPGAPHRPHLLPEDRLTRPSHPGRGRDPRRRAGRPCPFPSSARERRPVPSSSRERTRAACPTAQRSAPHAS